MSDHRIMGAPFKANGDVDQEQWAVLEALNARHEVLMEALKLGTIGQTTYEILWIDLDNDKQAFRRYVQANFDEANRLNDLTATQTGPGGLMMGRKR